MRLDIQGAGGGVIDYDSLTATPEDVPEGLTFVGHGTDDEQTGTLPDMSKMQNSPGVSDEQKNIPTHYAKTTLWAVDTSGNVRLNISPLHGIYPGDKEAYVSCDPIEAGIEADKIANGVSIGLVTGTYGSDATISTEDVREGKVAYGKNGRISGGAKDYGSVNKTLSAGESYEIGKGIYSAGKITAKDLSSQTSGNLDSARMVSGQSGYSNGKNVQGSMADRGPCAWAGRGGHGGGGIGEGTENGVEYYAFNNVPDGWYHNQGDDWSPELRLERWKVREYLGIAANKIILGQSVAGIEGNQRVFKSLSWSGTVTPSSDSKAIYDPNYGKNYYYKTFHYYPSGFREIQLVAWVGDGDLGFFYPSGTGHYMVDYGTVHMAQAGSLTFNNGDIEIPCVNSRFTTHWLFIAGVSW